MPFKTILLIITLSSLSSLVSAAPCEVFQGYELKEKLCFDKVIKGWISERCLNNTRCEARFFFAGKKEKVELAPGINGQNPATQYCHHLKLEVFILKDSHHNEQSFCAFKDGSIVDANTIEKAFQ